jgi:hypothetical protein
MDERAMTDLAALPLLATLPTAFLAGLALGYVYFRALRATADAIVAQGRPLFALALTLGRVALLGLGLYGAALVGGLALVSVLAGVLCAKAVMIRRAREAGT